VQPYHALHEHLDHLEVVFDWESDSTARSRQDKSQLKGNYSLLGLNLAPLAYATDPQMLSRERN